MTAAEKSDPFISMVAAVSSLCFWKRLIEMREEAEKAAAKSERLVLRHNIMRRKLLLDGGVHVAATAVAQCGNRDHFVSKKA